MESREKINALLNEMSKVVVGQERLINRLLVGLFTGGHVLLEGVPGLAKTLTINTLAKILDLNFHRIQFTPDLLPADLVGTMIYNPLKNEFEVKKGQFLRKSSLPMKLIVLQQRFNLPCWRPWRKNK